MADFFASLPFAIAFVVLFAGAMMRGQIMYWIGRGIVKVTLNKAAASPRMLRLHAWAQAGGADSGKDAIGKWGPAVVSFGYVTVGFQSIVQIAAGLLGMNLWLYVLAQIPGSLAWAAIYSTIGFAAWGAIMSAAAGSPAGIATLALLAAAVAVLVVRRRRKRANQPRSAQSSGSVP